MESDSSDYKRGDIYYADLRPVVGSEQGGVRPVLVIQNDVGNKHSPTVICAAITSRMIKAKLPTHVELSSGRSAMAKDSDILLEQLRTIDKQRLREKICHIDGELLEQVNQALKVSLPWIHNDPAERSQKMTLTKKGNNGMITISEYMEGSAFLLLWTMVIRRSVYCC